MTITTIPANDRRESFTASGGQTVFSFDFPVYAASDLLVTLSRAGVETVLVLTTDYTVTGAGNQAGGSITLTTGATAGDIITLTSNQPIARATSFVDGGDLPAASLNDEFNRVMIALQQLDNTGRPLSVSPGDGATNLQLPPVSVRALKYLGFDAFGNPTAVAGTSEVTPISTVMQAVVTAASLAAARAAMGVVAAVGAAITTPAISGGTASGMAISGGTVAGAAITGSTIDSVNGGPVAGFHNVIINGGHAIDQRNSGASQTFTAGAAGAYCIDRFYAGCTGANVTGARVNSLATVSDWAYRFTGAASNTGTFIGQRIEQEHMAHLAGSVTFSARIIQPAGSLGTVTWAAYYPNSKNNYAGRTLIASGTWPISNVAADRSATFTVPALATTLGLQVEITTGALGSGETWASSRWQVEPGAVATPFERRPEPVEWTMCFRRCVTYTIALNGIIGLVQNLSSSSTVWGTIHLPVPMAATPTVTFANLQGNFTDNTARAMSSVSVQATAGNVVSLAWVMASSTPAGQVGQLQGQSSGSPRLTLTAELT